jgi:hypothetical protein
VVSSFLIFPKSTSGMQLNCLVLGDLELRFGYGNRVVAEVELD